MLVEVTTVEQLVDRLKKGKFVSANEVTTKSKHLALFISMALNISLVFQSATDDDDIIAGHQKMTLKCPVCYIKKSQRPKF